MRELIRHILKENRLQQELKQFIEDNNIFDAAEMVGGLNNLKSIFKDNPEMSSIFDKLTGRIIFDYYVDKEHIEFPLDYEIIGRKSNIHKTNHWPEINVLYDENKLTPEENDTFKSMIKNLADDAQHSGFKSKFDDGRIFNANYLTVVELNGENIDSIWGGHYPWIYEVEEIYDKLYGRTESLNESEKDTKKLFKIVKMIMEDMILPEYNHFICSYEITLNKVFNIPEVTVLFIGGYGTKLWPMTQGIRQMYLDVLEDISKEIANYTGVVIGVRGEQTTKCNDKENIYLRESKTEDKEYSPAGKEIIPNEKVFHQSNPMFRNKIEEQGLKVRAGECYKIYAGYGEKCIPAIFATNSSNKRAWFDSTYDDDVWEIDTTKIPSVKWYKDRHYESRSKHIVTFENIPRDAIKLIYEGSGKDGGLMESESKSEDKKLKLLTRMIHEFFDEVSFIDIKKYENKPMIRVYFDNDEYAGNEETYFAEQIKDKIYEYTGIKLIPYWHNIQYNTDADFRLDAIKLKYDNEGNVINESDESKQERKFNKLIQNVEDYLNSNEYPSVKKFTVYYNDTHDDVIVNIFFNVQDSIKLGGGINSVIKRVGKQVMEDLEVFPMDFKYHIHFDRDINESEEKKPKYLNIIEDIIEPFKYEDCVCDIRVLYNEEDDMYLIDLNMGTEELNEKFFAVIGMSHYVSKLRRDIKETIKDYLPIDNFYVGSYASPNCKWKPLNESTFFLRRVDTRLMEKEFFENLNIITDVYLRKYIDGIDFNFETFENHVIDYFMDGYYDDLTNGGENDYPHDEVHEFLSKYFHDKIKDRYNLMFKLNINESSIKQKSLIKLLEKDGLYNFIEMSGLDFNQVKSILNKMDNPKELLKQYIRQFVIEDDPNSGENSGVLIGVEIPLSNTKYVNDIMVQDSDQIAVEIFEFGQDEYGHIEQKDQYLTTINILTNEELLSILSWMMETIKEGYRD